MKTIEKINNFAIALPIIGILFYPIFKDVAFAFSIYSIVLLGLIQIILGVIMLLKYPFDKHTRLYIIAIILFFITWYFYV
jgi:heme/copper-type cytochrome/quinol oxidase subunit 4